VVLNLVLIGVAIALDPLPLTAFLVVLPSRRGVVKGAAFVSGWLVSLAAVVAITVAATGNNPPRAAVLSGSGGSYGHGSARIRCGFRPIRPTSNRSRSAI